MMYRSIAQRRYVHLRRSGPLYPAEPGFNIKWAESLNELKDAFSLAYEEYLRAGYIKKPSPSRLHFNLHNLLPGSGTLIARSGDKIAGTLSIVLDSDYFGLPADALYKAEIDTLRAQGRRLCEMCTLAVASGFRSGRLIMPLFRSMYLKARMSKMDDICIMVNPKHVPFYTNILLFDQLGPERTYPRLDAPAVCLRLDLNLCQERLEEAYRDFEPAYNLWRYFDPELFETGSEQQPCLNSVAALYFLTREQHLLRTLEPRAINFFLSQAYHRAT